MYSKKILSFNFNSQEYKKCKISSHYLPNNKYNFFDFFDFKYDHFNKKLHYFINDNTPDIIIVTYHQNDSIFGENYFNNIFNNEIKEHKYKLFKNDKLKYKNNNPIK